MYRPLIALCSALLSPFLWAQPPAVSPIEAIHLVEAHIRNLTVTSVRPGIEQDVPVYYIEGRLGSDGYEAVVDARVARTVRIRKNGAPFYQWPGILVVAHRGALRYAPENTLAAFRKAIELGADLIEFDVRETRDGHLVVMHDDTVDRTTDGKDRVSALTLEQIKKLDAGSWFGAQFKGERVPTLDEALETIKAGAMPDIDFKAGSPEKLVAAVARHGLLGKITLYCGDWDLLRRTLAVSPRFLIRPSVPVGLVGLPVLIRELDPPIVNVDWPQFSERLIVEAHLAGRKVFLNAMGANDTEFGLARMMDAGPDYLQSDRLDLLLPMLRARGLHR
ncbi:MAG: glycerophosphodiester phosphodiesterase [Bryobacteraceae bacterium]